MRQVRLATAEAVTNIPFTGGKAVLVYLSEMYVSLIIVRPV